MYEKVIAIEPDTWQSQMNLGSLYYSLKDYEKAEKYTKKAQELNPSSVDLLISLAKIYRKLGKFAQANESLSSALQLDPQNKQVQELLRTTP